ncbi:MAG: hypothetical protein WD230_02365 [Cucumibacter sp.]
MALCAGAIVAGSLELQPLLTAGSSAGTYAALAEAPPPAGLSIPSQQAALRSCVEALTSIQQQAQPRLVSDRVNANCASLARDTLGANPVHSFAWYVLAAAAVERGDLDESVVALQRSQQTGQAEQWVGEIRVELAERIRPLVGDEALAFIDRDLAMLVQSRSGIGAIAHRYVSQPGFRARITEIVETLSEEDQARFVGWVASVIRSVRS